MPTARSTTPSIAAAPRAGTPMVRAYNQAPFKATQLYALAIPSRGGDTLFANGYAAYDALPERLKRRLDGVKGAFAYGGRRGGFQSWASLSGSWEPPQRPP